MSDSENDEKRLPNGHFVFDSNMVNNRIPRSNPYPDSHGRDSDGNESPNDHRSTSGSRQSHRSKSQMSELFKDILEFDAERNEHLAFKIDSEEDTIAIIFQKITPKDDGVYTCVANKSSGRIRCSAELTIKGRHRDPEPPSSSVEDPEVVMVTEGQSAMLETKLGGWPRPSVKWYKEDGSEVTSGERTKLLYDEEDESFALMIKTTMASDSGTYTVIGQNELGQASAQAQLTVKSSPKLLAELTNAEAVTNEMFLLSCIVQCIPEAEVKWIKDGDQVQVSNRVKIEKDGNEFILTINKSRLQDSGEYELIATNELGEARSKCTVTIKEPPKWLPRFTRRLTDYESRDGDEDIDFTAKVDARPPASIRWLYEGKELHPNELYRFETKDKEDGQLFVLWLSKVGFEHSGSYTCEASNSEGSVSSMARLVVNSKPMFTKVLKELKPMAPGSSVSLCVKATGHPKPSLKWLKSDRQVELDDRLSLDSENSTLNIAKIKEEDAGKYSCQASNIFGTASTECSLEVLTKPALKLSLQDVEVFEGDLNVDLKVEVMSQDGVQSKATWYMDDVIINERDSRFTMLNYENFHKLVISKVDESSEGTYKCLIANQYGDCQSVSRIKVNTKPRVISGLKDQLLPKGDQLTMKVIASGSPKPEVHWLKDGTAVKGDRISRLSDHSSASYSITINEAKLSDSGSYTCEISNCFGKEETSGNICITGEPIFRSSFSDTEATSGNEAEFKIELEPNAIKPTIKCCSLIIKNVQDSNTGSYRCSVSNKFGEIDCSANLTVHSKAQFTTKLADIKIPLLRKLTLEVNFSGNPKPEVKWFKDYNEIFGDERTVIKTEDLLSKLIVDYATEEDGANYSVRVSNEYGSDSTNSKVDITSKPVLKRTLYDAEIAHDSNDFELCVEVEEQPLVPEVKWFLNQDELTDTDERFEIRIENSCYKLILKRANENTAGHYKCSISNEFGQVESECSVSVHLKPAFVKELENHEVVEGSSLTMQIEVTGSPVPEVKFTKNGRELQDGETSSSLTILRESDLKFLMSFENISQMSAGLFEVTASNLIGSVSSRGILSVLTKPVIIKCNPVVFALLNQTSAIEATVIGNPRPKIKWYRDGAEMVASRCERSVGNGNIYRVNFPRVTMDDDADYHLTAANSVGSVNSRKVHFVVITEEERESMSGELYIGNSRCPSSMFEPAMTPARELATPSSVSLSMTPYPGTRSPTPEPSCSGLSSLEEPEVINKLPEKKAKREPSIVNQVLTTAGHLVAAEVKKAAMTVARSSVSACKATTSGIASTVRQVVKTTSANVRLPEDPNQRKVVEVLVGLVVIYAVQYLLNLLPPSFNTPKSEQKVIEKVEEYVFKCTSDACRK
ncbi:Muscle M-line assembly protein unc-89 [Halotydeus destructor]|nr:Muscle M-line assembly protein unc-89 [Halotydeus destructor]